MENIAQLGIKVDSSDIKKATEDLSKLSTQSAKTEKSTNNLSSIFSKANIAIGAIGASISYVTKQGIAYNATIEKLTNGLTTLNALTSSNVDNFGKQLSIQDKYNIASRESIETIAQLNKINLETPHTLSETVQIYKSMYSSMRSVGVSSEQMIDLTKKLSIAAGSSGIEFQQLLAGIDGLATGTVETGSELGRFLKSMGLGNEVLKQSTNIYETLNSKFKDVQGIIGYEEEISNLENSFDQLTGALVAPFFDDIKKGIHGLSSMFTDLTQSVTIFYDKFKSISELSTTDQLNKRAVEVTERIAEIQKDLADPSFFQSTGKLNAELRASNLELLSINDQFEKINKQKEQKTVSAGIDRNESEIIKLAGSELSKFNLQLEENINKLKKVGATEAEINKFRAEQQKEFNEKQKKSLDEQNKKLEETQKAYSQIAQIGMSQYDKSIASITEQTKEWTKAGVDSNTVLQAELELKRQLNAQNLLETLKEDLSYYERKLQLQKDSLDKQIELKGVEYANNILAIESSDKTIEQKQKLIALETDLYNQTIERLKADSNTEFQDTLKSFQEDSLQRQIELNNAIFDFGSGFKSSNNEIMEVSKSLAAMSDANLKSKKAENELNKKYTEQFTKYAGDVEKTKELEQQYTKDTDLLNKQSISNQILGYANIAGAISGMYKDGSKEAAIFQAAQTTLALVEGTRAILTAGTGDPYTAIPRMAAMAMMVKKLLGNIGVALGMNSSSTSGDSFSMANANTGTGTSLGDSKKASKSITKALETLEDFAQPQYEVLNSMNNYLEDIASNIGGVSSLLIRNAGNALGGGFTSSSSTKQNLSLGNNTTSALLGGAGTLAGFGAYGGFGALGALQFAGPAGLALLGIDKLLLGGAFTNIIGGAVNSVVGGLFGKTSVSKTLKDSGITFADTLLLNAKESFEGSVYQTIKTTTKKKSWFGSSTKTKLNTYFSELDGEIENQFSLVLGNIYDTVYQAGNALDIGSDSLNNSLNNFVVSIGKISLKDKTGTQIQESLTSIFGKIADDLTTSVFDIYGQVEQQVPIYNKKKKIVGYTTVTSTQVIGNQLTPFQQVGEGLFETLTRVATGIEEATYYSDKLGLSITKYTDIINKQGVVGFEALSQSILKAEIKNINFSDIISVLSGTAEELYNSYLALDNIRVTLESVTKYTDSLSISMISGAGSVSALSSGIKDYTENFLSENEKAKVSLSLLTNEFEKIDVAVPTSMDGFKELINGLDLTTESGQKLYGSLISLSGSFADLYANTATNKTDWARRTLTDIQLLEAQLTDVLGSNKIVAGQSDIAWIDATSEATLLKSVENARARAEADGIVTDEEQNLTMQLWDLYEATKANNEAKKEEIATEIQSLKERLKNTQATTDAQKLLLSREKELSSYTDATSLSLLRQIYAQEDLNTANEKALELENTRKSLRERLEDTIYASNESMLTQLKRQRELAKYTDETSISILKQIYAQEDLNTKISNRSSLIDNLKGFVESINDSITKNTTFKDFSTSFNAMIDAIKTGSSDLTTIGDLAMETAQSYIDTVSRTAKSSAEIEFAKKVVSNKFEGVINAEDITLGTINDTLKISFNENSVIVKALNDVKNELVYLNQLNTKQTANSSKTLQLQRASIA